MKNPNRLLKKIRTATNKNLRAVVNEYPKAIIPPIPKRYFPPESSLRMLYNESYYNHYIGLSYSALSTCAIILERITRILYKHFKPNGSSKDFENMVSELKSFFNNSDLDDKDKLVGIMTDFDYYREKIRNLLLHGKVEEYLKSTKIVHTAINVETLKKENLTIDYDKNIHGQRKFEILLERMKIDTQTLLVIISIVVQEYNLYIKDNLD